MTREQLIEMAVDLEKVRKLLVEVVRKLENEEDLLLLSCSHPLQQSIILVGRAEFVLEEVVEGGK